MRIDGEFNGTPVFGRRPTRSVSSAGGARRGSAAPSSNSQATSPLVSKLQESPEIRPDVIEDVRRRLQRGELLTREAAEATAAAILSDLQSFLRP